MACLRQELIDAFVESRYMMFIKYAALQLQQLGLKKQMDIFKETPAKEEAKVVSVMDIYYLLQFELRISNGQKDVSFQTVRIVCIWSEL